MTKVPAIDPHAVFTLAILRDVLGLREGSLPREVRQGRLRAHKRCGKYFFLGADVLDWLRGGEVKKGRDSNAVANGVGY